MQAGRLLEEPTQSAPADDLVEEWKALFLLQAGVGEVRHGRTHSHMDHLSRSTNLTFFFFFYSDNISHTNHGAYRSYLSEKLPSVTGVQRCPLP